MSIRTCPGPLLDTPIRTGLGNFDEEEYLTGVVFHGRHQLESYSVSRPGDRHLQRGGGILSAGKMVAHLLLLVYLLAEISRKVRGRCLTDSSAARGMMGRLDPGRSDISNPIWSKSACVSRFEMGKIGTLVVPRHRHQEPGRGEPG